MSVTETQLNLLNQKEKKMSGDPRNGPCLRNPGLSLQLHITLSLVLSLLTTQVLIPPEGPAGEHFPLPGAERRETLILTIPNLFLPSSYSCIRMEGLIIAKSGFLVYTGILRLKTN